jgi:hypothetical protein
LLCVAELQHEALAFAQVTAQDIEHLGGGNPGGLESAPKIRPMRDANGFSHA